VSDIRVASRATQGVKLVALDDKDIVQAVARVIPDDKEGTAETPGTPTTESDADASGELDLNG